MGAESQIVVRTATALVYLRPAGRPAPSLPDDGQTGALVNRRAFLGSLTAGLLAARARGEPFNPVNRSNRFAYFLFLRTSLAVLIPALALVFFAEPVADDFGRAVVVDVPHFVRTDYFHWSGRWAALGLEAFLLSKLPMLSVYSGILLALQVVHSCSYEANAVVSGSIAPRAPSRNRRAMVILFVSARLDAVLAQLGR